MYLNKIHITNFCNLKELQLDFHPMLNVIVGNNGMGKTNILDSINYLCLTRSNFSRLDKYNIRHEQDFMRLEGDFIIQEKGLNIVVKLQKESKKLVEKNGQAYDRLAEHIGRLPLVMIAPKDNVQILESSAERRKLIDKVLSQTDQKYLEDLISYNKLLEQRNALLKSGADMASISLLIKSYDVKMAPFANYISEKRKQFIDELRPFYTDLYQKISDGQEKAAIRYQSKLIDNDLLSLAQENFEKDYYLKRTSTGIHKDDVVFGIDGVSIKNFASQGQLKSIVLAFKLAQFVFLKERTETTPIILLDDVFDKLDRSRVKHLVKLLFEAKLGQVFISDTDRERVENTLAESGFSYRLFELENGQCKAQFEL